jgi:hypothetical protein
MWGFVVARRNMVRMESQQSIAKVLATQNFKAIPMDIETCQGENFLLRDAENQ